MNAPPIDAHQLRDFSPMLAAWIVEPSRFMETKPAGYPLRRTPDGVPWHAVNFIMCLGVPGWREWQAGLDMSVIIDALRRLSEQCAETAAAGVPA